MAGKRQHFIPQFLQKGFASHISGNQAFTWVYRKGKNAFNTNILNVGVEGFFYSEGDNSSLDDTITAAEGSLASFVETLRVEGEIKQEDFGQAAQLFAHLEVRTRHLRQSFFTAGNNLFNELMAFLSDPISCENYFRQKIKNDPSLIRDSVLKELRKNGLPEEYLPVLIQLSGQFIEQAIPHIIISQIPEMVAYFRSVMPEKLKEASKTGHIKALAQSIAPDVKVRRYEMLSYVVKKSEEVSLPLGDSVVLFHVSGERGFKTYLEKDDDLKAVILPISPHQALMGSVGNLELDFSILQRAIAGCSLEYFIASDSSPEKEQLINHISENSYLLSSSQIESLIDDIVN